MALYCEDCTTPMYGEPAWKRVCGTCFKRRKALELELLVDKLSECYAEITRLKAELAAKAQAAPIPPELLKKMIRLCHPDLHGNSEVSNDVTKFLLNLRLPKVA